jgi:hypothetical protein
MDKDMALFYRTVIAKVTDQICDRAGLVLDHTNASPTGRHYGWELAESGMDRWLDRGKLVASSVAM